MNSVCLDYEKVDFLANLLIPTLARHPISNSFPERGLALKEKHPELVGWPERKLGEVENYQNALSRQLPSLNSMSLPEFIDFILTPHVAEYVLEQVGTPLAGGEIECAHWMLDAAEQICKACEPAYQASEEPGVWYYDIAERLGAEVACRCVKGDISTDQLVAVAVNLTESWNTLSEDSNQEPDCGSYENTVRTLVERADTAEAACVEAVRILDGGERQALSKAIAILRPVAATLQ